MPKIILDIKDFNTKFNEETNARGIDVSSMKMWLNAFNSNQCVAFVLRHVFS